MGGTGTGIEWIFLDSIQEVWAGKDAGDAGTDAIVKTAAALPCLIVEMQWRLDVLRSDGAAVGMAGEVGKDLGGTALIRISRGRMADVEPAAAGALADAAHVIGAIDGHGSELGHAPDEVDFLAIAVRRFPDVLQLMRPLFPGKAYIVRAGRDKSASGHPFVNDGLGGGQIGSLDLVVLGAADRSRIHFDTIHGDDEGVRLVISFHAG